MKVIHEGQAKILKIWSCGKPAPGIWRLLTYTQQTACEEGTLLYNVMTGELLLLTAEEAGLLSGLPCGYAPWMDELIRKRFLVPGTASDRETADKLRTVLRMVSRSTALTGFTILPTTVCNARCFYCYESSVPHMTMTEETARDTVAFIAARHRDRPVRLDWFGGEPTVAAGRIDLICAGLRERGIRYSSSMISNGYLLTEPAVRHAKEDWKLDCIQITLDGTEEIYNRTKAYVSVTGSPYRQVLDNIGHLLDAEIRVSIRLNLGLHNAEDLETLVRELADRYEDKKYLSIYSHLLFENCGYTPLRYEDPEKDRLQEKETLLTELIRSLGFSADTPRPLPFLKAHSCMSDSDSSVIIMPDGRLGKCEHHIDDLFSGNVKEGFTDQTQLDECRKTISFPQCETCFYYPACIRLAVCADRYPCSDEIIREKREEVRSAMKQHCIESEKNQQTKEEHQK